MSFSHTLRRQRNVLGGFLKSCNFDPSSGGSCGGFCRFEGGCDICSLMNKEFLLFLEEKNPNFRKDLKEGDWTCLPATLWKEALDFGIAPLVDLDATNESSLKIVSLDQLIKKRYALWSENH